MTINGIAKGAGMIAPDMATMLSFVVTDAPIAAPVLQALLRHGVKDSFNAITVDSDTSTSDTLLLFATGAAAGAPRDRQCRATGGSATFREALDESPPRSRPPGGARRRGRAEIRRGAGQGRDVEALGAPDRACRSPIRRWSRRRSPARTPIGAASSWRSARRASRPTATAWPSGSATLRVAVKGERDPAYSEARRVGDT